VTGKIARTVSSFQLLHSLPYRMLKYFRNRSCQPY
jgi:hypothetical protein